MADIATNTLQIKYSQSILISHKHCLYQVSSYHLSSCALDQKEYLPFVEQEAQLMLTNLHNALRGQSRSPNMAPFDLLCSVSY